MNQKNEETKMGRLKRYFTLFRIFIIGGGTKELRI